MNSEKRTVKSFKTSINHEVIEQSMIDYFCTRTYNRDLSKNMINSCAIAVIILISHEINIFFLILGHDLRTNKFNPTLAIHIPSTRERRKIIKLI